MAARNLAVFCLIMFLVGTIFAKLVDNYHATHRSSGPAVRHLGE
ncbi:hypothetical protein [Aquibium microcysteis]|nr:hypothetical protein [Aquibium microcysteis]